MTTALLANRIIDGKGGPPTGPSVIIIEGKYIREIRPKKEGGVPEDALVLDMGEDTVLPGLIDSHTHPSTDFPIRLHPEVRRMQSIHDRLLRSVNHLQYDLRSGSTTVRILGELEYLDIALETAIEDGTIPGPRLLPAGKGPRSTLGHGFKGTPADGVDNIRRLIRESIMRGARQIKIFVTGGASDRHTKSTESYYSREEIEAGIDEAHRAGRRVSLHLNGGIAAPWAIKSGADTLEHGGALTADDFDLMLKNGTWLGATPVNVSIEEGMTREQREDPIISEKIKQAREAIRRVYPMAIQAAIPYVIGTDGLHGLLPRGVEFMVEFGASPMEAILAVTSRAAQLAGLEHVIGTVEPGKYADIISVAGNPLEDISSLQRLHLIMKEGRRYDDGALGQLGTQRVDEIAQRLPTPGL